MGEFLASLTDVISNPYVIMALLTLAPALELRASIPYGIMVAEEPWWAVLTVAVVTNIVLGPVVFLFLDKFMHLLLRIGWVDRIWQRLVVKTQKKIKPKVDKYGIYGLGLFIGVPLPGSGVYSGAIGGYLLGFTKKEFYLATVIGVLIAAAAVTTVVMTGATTFQIFYKH